MENIRKNNSILKVLQAVFEMNSENKIDTTKYFIFKLLFENKLIDICGHDIFFINNLLFKINSESETVTYDQFLKLIFFIYTQQKLKILTEQNDEESLSELEIPIDVHDVSSTSINVVIENRQMINSCSNIVKVLMDQKEKGRHFFDLCLPLFSVPEVDILIDPYLIDYVNQYSKDLREKVYNKYFKHDKEKNIFYINIFELKSLLFDFHIFHNFDCEAITSVLCNFFYPKDIDDKIEELEKIFDEKMSSKELKDRFNSIDLDPNEINFSFSTLVLILCFFALKLNKDEKDIFEAIDHFFQNVLEISSDKIIEEIVIEESVVEEEVDFYPESSTLEEAKKMHSEPHEDDDNFLHDCLVSLDKELPEIPVEIKSMMNPTPNQSNTIFYNPVKIEKVKFPLNTVMIEIEELNKKKAELKEQMVIERARKAKKANPKDPGAKVVFFEDLPDKDLEQSKYYGNKPAEDLKKRLLKNSYKDILYNNSVHPSLVKEVLIIPQAVPKQVIETMMLAFTDQNKGDFEMAIRKFEKAQKEFFSYKILSTQVDLYFFLTFGSFYENLELNLMAMKYYYKAKFSSDKAYLHDPDTALVYCYLGSLMIRLREYEWALRCFLKAKDIRENSIGGDTVDTATVYNNLGVCCYHLNCYYPAKGYFALSYEIYKHILGCFNQRTLVVKTNISKLSHLNFSKPFEYKSAPMFQTIKLLTNNPKKAKK